MAEKQTVKNTILPDKCLPEVTSPPEKGVLYVVATPIGNLQDITLRALHILGHVDLILAEDTRVSLRLLHRFQIKTPLKAFHEHNEEKMAPWVANKLKEGICIALISDAGTPLVRDPGFHLIRLLRAQGMKIVPIPGPSALVCALSVAGLPADKFIFEGFLPARRKARQQQLQRLAQEPRTMVFYEAPHRILATVSDMAHSFGPERHAIIARELTKTFETIYAGSMTMVGQWIEENKNNQRGEFVLLVEGLPKARPEEDGDGIDDGITTEDRRILQILLEELPKKQAITLATRLTGRKKNSLYRLTITESTKENADVNHPAENAPQ